MFNINSFNVKQFRGQGFMTFVKYSHDGKFIFISDKDSKCISLISTQNNQLIGTYNGHNGVIWSLDVTKDFKYMISCSGDMSCILWDVENGEIINKISENGIPKNVSIDGDLVVIACDPISKRSKSYISIHSLSELVEGKVDELYKLVETENIRATNVKILSDDVILVSYDNGLIKKINFKTNVVELKKKIHEESIKTICFSNDKTKILTASSDCSAKIIDIETFSEICLFKSIVPINTAIFTPDNKYVLLGGGIEAMMVAKTSNNDLTTKIFQVSNQKLIKQITNHFGPLRCLDFNPDSSSFTTASQDGLAKIHYFKTVKDETVEFNLFGNAYLRENDELLLLNETIKLDDESDKLTDTSNKKNNKVESVQQYPVGHSMHNVVKEVENYALPTKIKNSIVPTQVSSIRITNLPDDVELKELWDIFEFYGRIENNGIRIKQLYNDTIAFVNYLNPESAKKAIEKCNKMRLSYCVIGVEMANYN